MLAITYRWLFEIRHAESEAMRSHKRKKQKLTSVQNAVMSYHPVDDELETSSGEFRDSCHDQCLRFSETGPCIEPGSALSAVGTYTGLGELHTLPQRNTDGS